MIARPRTTTRPARRALVIAAALLVAMAAALPSGAAARSGSFRMALIKVSYSDTSSQPYSATALAGAADEMESFFRDLSNGQLDLTVTPTPEVTLANTQASYFSGRPGLIEDAAEAAARAGFSFDGLDGIMVYSPGCQGAFTNGPIAIDRPGVRGTFQRSYVFGCPAPPGDPRNPPGPSGVWWNGWAHEIGHMLQLADGIPLDDPWVGHPSGYSSGYDLMDSCYPCSESAYGLSGRPRVSGPRPVFPGSAPESNWLPDAKAVTVDAPTSGRTVVLAPLSTDPGATPAAQWVRVPVAGGRYYVVEARRRTGVDSLNVAPGIWDEGVHILEVDESRNPPVRPVDSCDTTVAGGCVRADGDARASQCNPPGFPRRRGDKPDFCWPYPLWHAGDTFNDNANNVQIRVDGDVGDGMSVTVARGPIVRRPDVLLIPWLTPPLNTWETVDIWVDSSCNGYGRFSHGRHADGTPHGNGDDLCVDHENRLHARIRNGGDAEARDIRVEFRVPDRPLPGVRPRERFRLVGTARVARLAAGRSAEAFVTWTPRSSDGRYLYNSGITVTVPPVAGELVTSNQDGDDERENLDYLRLLRRDRIPEPTIHRDYWLINPLDDPNPIARPPGGNELAIRLAAAGGEPLPKGVSAEVPASVRETKSPKGARLPVEVELPESVKPGTRSLLQLDATGLTSLVNEAIPEDQFPAGRGHLAAATTGVGIGVEVVRPNRVEFGARRVGGSVGVTGRVLPAPRTVITLDYVRGRKIRSRLVRTNRRGRFAHGLRIGGSVSVRVISMGDRDDAGVVTPLRKAG
jgi:hypothetical protein